MHECSFTRRRLGLPLRSPLAAVSALITAGFAGLAPAATVTIDTALSSVTRYAFESGDGSPSNPTESLVTVGTSGASVHGGSSVSDTYAFSPTQLRTDTVLVRGAGPTPDSMFSAAHTKGQITFTAGQAVSYVASGLISSLGGITFLQLSASLVDETNFGLSVFEYMLAENQQPIGTTFTLDPSLLPDLSGTLEAGHTYTWTYELSIRRNMIPQEDVYATASGFAALSLGGPAVVPAPDAALGGVALIGVIGVLQLRRRADGEFTAG